MRMRLAADAPYEHVRERFEVHVEQHGDGEWWTDEISHSNLAKGRAHEVEVHAQYPGRPTRIMRTTTTIVLTFVGPDEAG